MRWLWVRERRGLARSLWRRRVTVSGHPTARCRRRMIRREFGWLTARCRRRMIRRESGWFSAYLSPIIPKGSANSFVSSRGSPK